MRWGENSRRSKTIAPEAGACTRMTNTEKRRPEFRAALHHWSHVTKIQRIAVGRLRRPSSGLLRATSFFPPLNPHQTGERDDHQDLQKHSGGGPWPSRPRRELRTGEDHHRDSNPTRGECLPRRRSAAGPNKRHRSNKASPAQQDGEREQEVERQAESYHGEDPQRGRRYAWRGEQRALLPRGVIRLGRHRTAPAGQPSMEK